MSASWCPSWLLTRSTTRSGGSTTAGVVPSELRVNADSLATALIIEIVGLSPRRNPAGAAALGHSGSPVRASRRRATESGPTTAPELFPLVCDRVLRLCRTVALAERALAALRSQPLL